MAVIFLLLAVLGFFLRLWIPLLHFTEKEWLLVQLLTKPGKCFDDTCISYSTVLPFTNMQWDHGEAIKPISSVGMGLNFLPCNFKFLKDSNATWLTVKKEKRKKTHIKTKKSRKSDREKINMQIKQGKKIKKGINLGDYKFNKGSI